MLICGEILSPVCCSRAKPLNWLFAPLSSRLLVNSGWNWDGLLLYILVSWLPYAPFLGTASGVHLPHKSPAEYIIPRGLRLIKDDIPAGGSAGAKNRTKLVSVSDRLMTPDWFTLRIKCPKLERTGLWRGGGVAGRSAARVADPQEECWFMFSGSKLVRSRAKRTVTVVSCDTCGTCCTAGHQSLQWTE